MTTAKPFHLPYNQYDSYWICLWPDAELHPASLITQLVTTGFQKRQADREYYVCPAGKQWVKTWNKLKEILAPIAADVKVAIVAGGGEPDVQQIAFSHKPVAEIQKISECLWLGDAILRGDILCYFQPVMTQKDKAVGYESFARVRAEDGSIIGGGEIVKASRVLGIEYALDRYLHVQAIKTYIAGNLSGYLFVNFFPGFIQRPEVYLEGLSEAVRMHGIISKQVVLDFTESEHEHDLGHLKKVVEFCRSKGYAIALDDVESTDNAETLVPQIKPDFVKLSRKITATFETQESMQTLRQIITLSHSNGAVVLAEGIEEESVYAKMHSMGVDMFQGYLFAAPAEIKPDSKKAAI
jgi:EAL domain-containing protein (putative c-di-GMP-specific phosphodiesterase class I)